MQMTHTLQKNDLCINHFGGGCKQDETRCRFKHGTLEQHGLDSKDFKHFFADHSLLMKKAGHDCPPLPPDDKNDDEDDCEPTKVCSMRQIPYNPKRDLYDSDDDYTGSHILNKRR